MIYLIIFQIESERIRWYLNHQREVRSAEYGHVRDEINNNDHALASNLGMRVVLPGTFVGGPRYMHSKAQDGLTYVRVFGRPDLFITFTCNPRWEEIINNLIKEPHLPSSQQQKQEHRHDITARVFNLKLKKMIQLFKKGECFGPVQAIMHTIE